MHETGAPEVLRHEKTARPELGDGEVLIRVRAAAVNPVDWKYRRGFVEKPLPAVLGNDVSGTVEVSRADGFAEGDEVFGLAASGGDVDYTQQDVADAASNVDVALDTVGGETTECSPTGYRSSAAGYRGLGSATGLPEGGPKRGERARQDSKTVTFGFVAYESPKRQALTLPLGPSRSRLQAARMSARSEA